MRNMSFALTTDQIIHGSKTETRRMNWKFAKVGMMVMPVLKGMGLKKGEKVQYLRKGPIRFTALRWEPLNAITPKGVEREGFPGKSPEWFVDMFTRHNRCAPDHEIHVMTFEYLYLCGHCGAFECKESLLPKNILCAPFDMCGTCAEAYEQSFLECSEM
jgi:hypothetical protein